MDSPRRLVRISRFFHQKCRRSINKRKFSPSPLLELCVFTFYLKSTNLTTQVDPSFLPAVVPPNLFTAIETKSWHLSSKLYHLTFRTGNVRLKFFVTLISLAKTNLFSLQILHLFILSFPMTKVSGPSNIFSINARLGNLALKRYELVITHSFFSFGGNYYKQTSGVAMGTKTALH